MQATTSVYSSSVRSHGCGKSAWVLRLVDATEMIEPPPDKIYYCYGEYQPVFNTYPQVTLHKCLPEIGDEVFDG